ncbi:MAG: YicC family protein [Deltaproteobacteria bacterium]|nr:YicC family protein [Deltaproteobacteria bacterium]
MTGYGSAAAPIPGGRVTIEVRSVNQRFLDVRVTAPREYGPWEAECRETVRAHVARGRVEVHVSRGAPPIARTHVVLNPAAAREHAAAWRRLMHELGLPGPLEPSLFRTPEIFQTVEMASDVRPEFPGATRALRLALVRFDRERRREGANLHRDMRARIDRLAAIERSVRRHAATTLRDVQAKLAERMECLLQGSEVDLARVAQEAALVADRADVTEEMVRLASHLSALRGMLGAREPVGKQIEFLLQEAHREINTIGSKINNLAVTQLVVEAKGEVERLREQVQNVE